MPIYCLKVPAQQKYGTFNSLSVFNCVVTGLQSMSRLNIWGSRATKKKSSYFLYTIVNFILWFLCTSLVVCFRRSSYVPYYKVPSKCTKIVLQKLQRVTEDLCQVWEISLSLPLAASKSFYYFFFLLFVSAPLPMVVHLSVLKIVLMCFCICYSPDFLFNFSFFMPFRLLLWD